MLSPEHSARGRDSLPAGSVLQWAPQAASDWPGTGQPRRGTGEENTPGRWCPPACRVRSLPRAAAPAVLADSLGPLPLLRPGPRSPCPAGLCPAPGPLSVPPGARAGAGPAAPAALGSRGPPLRTCLDLAWAAVGPRAAPSPVSQSLSAMAGRAGKAVRPAAPQQLRETRRRDVPRRWAAPAPAGPAPPPIGRRLGGGNFPRLGLNPRPARLSKPPLCATWGGRRRSPDAWPLGGAAGAGGRWRRGGGAGAAGAGAAAGGGAPGTPAREAVRRGPCTR